MNLDTAVAGALDLVPLRGRRGRRRTFLVCDAGRACSVVAFPPCARPCARPPVVAIRGMFSGETFYACHAHQARILGRRRWLTTTVTPARGGRIFSL